MIVSMINLMICIVINTVKTQTLADLNVTKPFQKRPSALFAILSNNFSFKRFIMDILPSNMGCPMALLL